MRKLSRLKHALYFVIAVALFTALANPVMVSAQPTQALTEDWRDSDFSFTSRMMAADLNGNIYVLGDTVVGDYLVIKKFSPAGTLLWQTTYDPADRLRGVWIAVDGGGNPVVLASIITGSNADPAGWLTLKYDTSGTLQWANSLPGPFRDARRVAVDAANNIYVAGRMFLTNSTGNTTLDSVLIKYTPSGSTAWTANFDNNSAVDEPYALSISPDGSRIAVAGISGLLFMGLMYDANGNLLWSNTNRNAYPANDVAFGAGNTSYFATGTYFPQDPNPYQMAIARFDAAGNQLWVKSYSVGDKAYRVRVDGQGNVIATGVDQAGYLDWMTIKTDANGNLLWSQRYDGGRNNDEKPNMLLLDAAGAVYVTGTGGPNPSSGTVSYLKGVVAKYAPDGTPVWAVWDVYAGGKAIVLGAGNTLASLGFGYLVTTHYTQTGLPDLIPAAPTNLSGYADFNGASYRVRLSFADNANNEFWVEVERCTGSGCVNFSRIGQTLGEDSTGFRDETVSGGVVYTYRVRARGFMGASGASNTVEVTIPPSNPPASPAAPSSLVAAAVSKSQIALTWTNGFAGQDGVKIERCTGANCTNFSQIATLAGTPSNYTDSGLSANTAYRYRVRAYNSAGDSPYSNIASAKTLKK